MNVCSHLLQMLITAELLAILQGLLPRGVDYSPYANSLIGGTVHKGCM